MTKIIIIPWRILAKNFSRCLVSRSFSHRLIAAIIVVGAFLAPLVMPRGNASAQQAPLHLNPAVEKLAHGQPIIGTQTDDMSLQNCHSLSRMDFDYSYVDMEHGPLNLDGLAYCVAAMVDKAAVLKKGNAQPNVALFARFPPYGRDLESNDWIVKQALDMGVEGIMAPMVRNVAECRELVRACRYPPQGGRGFGPRRASNYYRNIDDYVAIANEAIFVMPQIEDIAVSVLNCRQQRP